MKRTLFDGTINRLEVVDDDNNTVCSFRGELARRMVVRDPKEAIRYTDKLYRAAMKNEKLTIE